MMPRSNKRLSVKVGLCSAAVFAGTPVLCTAAVTAELLIGTKYHANRNMLDMAFRQMATADPAIVMSLSLVPITLLAVAQDG